MIGNVYVRIAGNMVEILRGQVPAHARVSIDGHEKV
jgi:hypothetical protein